MVLQVNTFQHLPTTPSNTLLAVAMNYMCQSGEDGACGIISCMMLPEVQSGQFWGCNGDLYGPAVSLKPEKICTAEESKRLLWECSEKAVGEFSSKYQL